MPLARILTLRPEETTGLSQQLQQLGFDVEVTSPHERNLGPAELEIEFAVCDQQQVVARASAIATQLEADVFVFPSALPPMPKSIVVEEAPVFLPEPVEVQPLSLPVESPVQVETPVQNEPEPVHAAAAQDSSEQLQRVAWSVTLAEALRKFGRRTGSVASAIGSKMRDGSVRMMAGFSSAMLKFRNKTSAAGTAVADRKREYQERLRAKAAQAQAARAQRLAQMERLRAEAREQVATLERARMAAEAHHQQLQRLDAEEQPVRRRQEETPGPRILQLRGVFAGAIAAVALFVAGILLANFHNSSPLPPDITGSSIEQPVPFGPATVHGAPGVTLTPSAPKSQPHPPITANAPHAASKPQPAVHTAQAKKPKRQGRHFRNRSTGEEDDATNDVVVRHFGPQKKPTTQTAQRQTGIKRYSDQ